MPIGLIGGFIFLIKEGFLFHMDTAWGVGLLNFYDDELLLF